MANKRISQLSATTQANDNVWLVINNSGETETFKIKRVDLLSGATTPGGFIQGDASQSLVPYYKATSVGATADTTYVDKLYSVSSQIDATDDSVVINSTGTSAIPAGKPRNAVINSIDGVISSSSNDGTNTILGTYQGTISAGGVGSIFGGGGSQIRNTASLYNTIVGGNINEIRAGNYNTILGGRYADITSGTINVIVGGNNSQLTGGDNSAMLGGANNTSTHSQSVMLGGSSISSVYDNTAHAENAHTFKTESFDVEAVGNVGGSVDVDCSLATIYTFTMTADTAVNFVSPRTGQRFIFIVENTTFNVTGATVNGTGSTVFAKNGTLNPSSNAITKYTATYDGSRMFLDEELNFSAV